MWRDDRGVTMWLYEYEYDDEELNAEQVQTRSAAAVVDCGISLGRRGRFKEGMQRQQWSAQRR